MRATYLITGGTGSLGREILPRIMRADPSAEVAFLLRGKNRDEIGSKLDDVARYLTLYASDVDLSRVRPVPGDVTLPNLGLSAENARSLSRRVTHIVHAAASIRLNQRIDLARDANLHGTGEVLRFAKRCPRLACLGHVSTAYVAGDRVGTIREEDLLCGQLFHNSYEQSKCEAEVLVHMHAGLFPILIFRPSIIVGDSSDGHTCNFTTLYYPLKMIANGTLQRIPGRARARLDIVPVDYVAEGIVRLVRNPPREIATYHLTAGGERSIPAGDLMAAAVRLCGGAGQALPQFTAPRDARSLEAGDLACFFAYLSGSTKNYDDSVLRRDLGLEESACPDPRSYVHRLFSFCTSTRWGHALPWNQALVRMAA